MMQPPSGTGHDVLFAHGRTGVLQQLLLARTDVDRLLGAHDAAEVARIFTELKLSSRIDQGLADPDKVLQAIAAWVQEEVLSMAPEEYVHVFDILWLESDVPLLAYLLKKHFQLTSAISVPPAPAITTYGADTWQELIDRGTSDILPSSAVQSVQRALAMKDPLPAELDTLAAQWGAARQLELAKQSKRPLIIRFVRHSIDLQNIRTTLRALDIPKDERRAMLLPGGTLPEESFLGTRQTLHHAIVSADIGFTLTGDMESSDHRALEQQLSAVLAEDIAALWNVPLSIEPLFAFAALTLQQLRLLRALLLAKRAGFSPQDTKAVLPPFIPATHYVL